MKIFEAGGLLLAATMLALAPPASFAESDGTVAVTDTAAVPAIRALWASLDSHWNDREARPFSETFTRDASFRFVDRNESLQGRKAIHAHFSEQFPRFPADIRHSTTVQAVRVIMPGVSAMDGTVEIIRLAEQGNHAVIRTFTIFAVMLETDDGWKTHELRVWQLPG